MLRSTALVLACVLAPAGAVSAQTTISSQQAEAILQELRAIRQALERMGGMPGAPAVPAPAPVPAPEGPVKLASVSGYMLGKPDAPLTMIEFTDLQCPFCNRFTTQTFDQLKKAYIDTGKVRFVSRDFPLDFHPQARPAAAATRCAGEQGRFWELRTTLVSNADKLSPDYITIQASALKLDMKAFKACQSSGKFDADIQKDLTEGAGVGVTGTPTFLIGRTAAQGFEGTRIVGAQPLTVFTVKIDELLKQ